MTPAIKIDREVTIVEPGLGLNHTMLHLKRHPDGSIYVNTHALGLFRSADGGQTWKRVPLHLPNAPPNQDPGGFGISRDGRLWLVHQRVHAFGELFVSFSQDHGTTWQTTPIDFAQFAPGAPEDPYVTAGAAWCYVNFIERPDGTLMFSLSLRYQDSGDYAQSYQTRPGIRNVMIRTTDGGKTWGHPTIVHQHASEMEFAADPNDPDHILAMTRIQRQLLPGEDRRTVEQITGCPPNAAWVYKQGLLLESNDGGRSFREVRRSLTRYYEHRGSIHWTERNVVVITHEGANHGNVSDICRVLARISIDGGQTWLNDAGVGTPSLDESKKFVLVPNPPGSCPYTAPTIEVSPHRFLTVYTYVDDEVNRQRGGRVLPSTYDDQIDQPGVNGLLWHLENFE